MTGLDLEGLKEIYFLRIKLAELIGASSTTENVEEVKQKIDALLECCYENHDHLNLESHGRINIGLHIAIQRLISNQALIAMSDTLFYQTARMWFKILTDNEWGYEIDSLIEEMRAIRRYLDAEDLESVGYVRRNHLSIVAKRLDSLVTNIEPTV